MFEHIIGIAYREGMFEEFPKDSWVLPLGQVASVGRPQPCRKHSNNKNNTFYFFSKIKNLILIIFFLKKLT
jgi:hypothetical protein